MTVQDQVQKSLKLVGRVLGDKFKLTACIGIGGSGAVYKADQIALGRTVAVKILNEELCADPRMITRFRGEAMSASWFFFLNCVSIIDYGQSPDGLLYLAMENIGKLGRIIRLVPADPEETHPPVEVARNAAGQN